MKNNLKLTEFKYSVTKYLNHKKFFESENPKRPNDEGRVSSTHDGPELSPDINQGNDDSGATSMDETNNTHPEGTVLDETDFINDFYENSEFNSKTEELPIHTLRRYKARLVVKSFNKKKALKEGIDFDESFFPVVKTSIVKCVVALSITNNWSLFQLDVNNAFLYGNLDEDIYMTIPKGFASKDKKNKVCKLVKSLHGLKQAPKKWNEKLVSILKENGFVQSSNDHSLFTRSKSNKFIALLIYVDDIVITGNCVDEIDKFKIFLKSKFKIKDLGHLKYFMGIEVIKTRKDLCLSQRKYCLELLKEYGLLGCKQCAPDKGIRYNYGECNNNLSGYIDADWAKCLKTKKFVTGYCVFFNNCLISWKSKKQNTISKSFTEAEYRSLSSAACEIIWIQKLLLDLNTKVSLPIDLHCDNKFALQLAINPIFYERSKHFKIDVHFIREKIAKRLRNTKKISSLDQTADILTKHLPVYQHKHLCEKLRMFDLFSNQIKEECSNK
uniref:Ribonuclease H-like domain-containing protein n=1 Tax=Tanacetum cinerariifolium TaxID=118510 RepID=A0A6L2J7I7_TANCI|nr:ribonuclease H-like domain-containing protein [Tanacetum cinerariifolium]